MGKYKLPVTVTQKFARISQDGRYRYMLGRSWEPYPYPNDARAIFIMLHPSTADAEIDDPTIRRCIDYAARWGFGSMRVANLYAFRATRPADVFALPVQEREGPDNQTTLHEEVTRAPSGSVVVIAWGAQGAREGRGAAMRAQLAAWGVTAHAIARTMAGEPIHPLYQRGDAPLVPWHELEARRAHD